MQRYLFSTVILSCLLVSACASNSASTWNESNSTFYLVRHAEKEKSEFSNPELTAKGRARAQNLAVFLSSEKIDAVYSTDTTRTRDTASPIARKSELDINLYSPRDLDYDKFLRANQGKTVVVVGHSNTTPKFANGLIKRDKYQDLNEDQYDHIFVIDVINGIATSKVLLLTMNDETQPTEVPMPEHEKINYMEYPAKDIEATKTFFTKTFGWEFVDYGPEYTSFSNQGTDGGFFKAELVSSSDRGAALTVLYSDTLEKTLDKVVDAGGVIIKSIFSFPGGRRFHFTEPSGNEFAVWGE